MTPRLLHKASAQGSQPRSLAAAMGIAAIVAAMALPVGAQAAIVPHVVQPNEVTTRVVTPTPAPSSSSQAVAPAPSPPGVAPATSPAPTPPGGGSQGGAPSSQSSGSGQGQGDSPWRPGGIESDQFSGNPFLFSPEARTHQAVEIAIAIASGLAGIPANTPPTPTPDPRVDDGPSNLDVLGGILNWLGINYNITDGPNNTGAR
jgi:hypothetical protein